jgi:molybdenum-dependent DNA-binding transcriptional regulator ModE
MDWDKLRVFFAVAEAGSFTHAGEVLNLSQSAVSRQVSALEESLEVPLFHRHARGLVLTEQGDMDDKQKEEKRKKVKKMTKRSRSKTENKGKV